MAGDESTLAPVRRRRAGSMELLLIALTALALSGSWVSGVLTDHARLAAAATVFCGVFVQALPFLVLGVIVSGLVAAYLTPERLARRLPRRPALAVAVAGVGGAALPGCECGSVPVARRLFSGETAGAALTFMLSAPAINPVVLVATAVAFPGQPQMVAGHEVSFHPDRRRIVVHTGIGRLAYPRCVLFSRVASVRVTLLGRHQGESSVSVILEHEEIEMPPTPTPRQEGLLLAMMMGVRLVKVYGDGAPAEPAERIAKLYRNEDAV